MHALSLLLAMTTTATTTAAMAHCNHDDGKHTTRASTCVHRVRVVVQRIPIPANVYNHLLRHGRESGESVAAQYACTRTFRCTTWKPSTTHDTPLQPTTPQPRCRRTPPSGILSMLQSAHPCNMCTPSFSLRFVVVGSMVEVLNAKLIAMPNLLVHTLLVVGGMISVGAGARARRPQTLLL